jgi:hypothetical protein
LKNCPDAGPTFPASIATATASAISGPLSVNIRKKDFVFGMGWVSAIVWHPLNAAPRKTIPSGPCGRQDHLSDPKTQNRLLHNKLPTALISSCEETS